MKRALILGLMLAALALACLIGAGVAVEKTAQTIVWTETPLHGDRAAAAGVQAAVGTSLDRRLLWDSTLSFGAETTAAETDFHFFPYQASIHWEPEARGLTLWAGVGGGYGFTPGKTVEEIKDTYHQDDPGWKTTLPLFLAAAAQTGAGEKRVTVLRLRDFYEYYPIDHSLDLGNMGGSTWGTNVQPVQDFFRIPVPEGARVSVQVEKNAAGLVTNVDLWMGDDRSTVTAASGVDAAWAYPDSEPPMPAVSADLGGVSAVTADYCFFAFAAYDGEGRSLVDTSCIPGGRGVYRLPWSKDENGYVSYDATELETVFPLPEEEPVLALGADRENRPLLFTAADGALTLTVLDPTGRTALQQVALGAFDPGGGWGSRSLRVFDGWLLLESSRGDLTVAEQGADGLWRAGLQTSRAEVEAHWPQPEDPDAQTPDHPSGSYAYAWDGRRLAVAEGLFVWNHLGSSGSSGDFLLEIFDESGLAYFARLDSSLTVPPPSVMSRYEYVRAEEGLNGTGGFRIWFT